MTVGIIMAGGKGKRFGVAGMNKTAQLFLGKPLVRYGTDFFSRTTDKIIVVVGVESDSVKSAIGDNSKVEYAYQRTPLGTGDALKVAIEKISGLGWNPGVIFIGNGDHMMFYDPGIVREMEKKLAEVNTAAVMLTTEYSEPDKLLWGRVVRNDSGEVERIVEQKDATPDERKITELNTNFYAFGYEFARENYFKIKPSPVSGEYYITEMVELAIKAGKKVAAIRLPFEQVGVGINTREELDQSIRLYRRIHGSGSDINR